MHISPVRSDEWRSISRMLPDFRYYNEYISQPSNVSVHLTYNGIEFLIPTERIGNLAIIHPRTFAADLYSREEVTIGQKEFQEILLEAKKCFSGNGISELQFKAIPEYISNTHDKWLDGCFSHEVETSVIDLDRYKLSSRRQRNLRKIDGLTFNSNVDDPEVIFQTWTFMLEFLKKRNLPGLDSERIKYLIVNFPETFRLATVTSLDFGLEAAAFVNRIGNCVRLPNYFSTRNLPGAIDYLLDSIIREARASGLTSVDLGVSTDPNSGEEIAGIVQFKSEFSAQRKVIKKYKFSVT